MIELSVTLPESKIKLIVFRKALMNESDSGCALLATGKIDIFLSNLLKTALIGSKTHFRDLFNSNGPLATFSSRIKLAYSVGLISKNLHDEINNLRAIRNEFAHSDEPISFDHPAIDKLFKRCKFIPQEGRGTKKDFITTTLLILTFIDSTLKIQKKFLEPSEPFTPEALNHLAKSVNDERQKAIEYLQSMGVEIPNENISIK